MHHNQIRQQVLYPFLSRNTWQTYPWQNLVIPIPPKAQWERSSIADINAHKLPVVAAGGITYPTITDGVELPYGPSFTIIQFTGSLDDWLTLERQNSPKENPIEEATVRDIMIAGLPAKAYRYTATGTGLTEFYVTNLRKTGCSG